MKSKVWLLAFFLVPSLFSEGVANEIRVSPGVDTLSAAVNTAFDGDTLVLEDGVYYGPVLVNKSLTIRPVNRSTYSAIAGVMAIDGVNINVTVQGLRFANHLNLERAASVRVLENEWVSGSLNANNYRTSEGDGSLFIVGNRMAAGSRINDIRSDGAYVAGNVLAGGWILVHAYAWVVGNEIWGGDGQPGIMASNGSSRSMVLANRVLCDAARSFTFPYTGCVDVRSPSTLIASNVVKVNDRGSFFDGNAGIYFSGTGTAEILNNVVYGTPPSASQGRAGILADSGMGRISGNIVVQWTSNKNPIDFDPNTMLVTHNICYNSSGNCPPGEGNRVVDPRFVDYQDFRLRPDSPAINAGPPDDGLADLDRTRNDMGVYGGPWSIGQYDAQRDPNNFAPYVYPLFNAGSILSGDTLEVHALGVARLR